MTEFAFIEELTGDDFEEKNSVKKNFPFMPEGQAFDMGKDGSGKPLIDPRIFDAPEFFRNPYPYYRILRDHYPIFHDKIGIPATARASIGFYNSKEDIDILCNAINNCKKVFNI